ncbi:MAG TPA: hypothetical protein VFO11_10115, partial [Candidatus Polarisedimenticolaceae bacterium]|nr:hypothetical protein [Candidatus Polarisedimenticolaceae bacterium]
AGFLGLLAMLFLAGDLGGAYAITVPLAIMAGGVFVLVAIRSGILAVVVILVVLPLLVTAPLTLDLSRWYAGRGLVILAAVLGSTIWAFWTSLGGRRALGFVKLADA